MDWRGLLYKLEDWWYELDKRRLTEVLVTAAVAFLLTAYARIGFDMSYTVGREQHNAGVCATVGDVCLYAAVLLNGPVWAAPVCAVAMALADLAVGAKLYFIGTLLIKFAMVWIIALFAVKVDTYLKGLAIAGITELSMLVLYFLYGLVFVSVPAALKAILVDLLQTAVCAPLGALVLWKMPVFRPREMPHIRRKREIGRFDGEI